MNDLEFLTTEAPLVAITIAIGAVFILGLLVVLPFTHMLKKIKERNREEKEEFK